MQRFGCSQRNALRLVKMSASTYLYQPVKKDESALKMRIKEITDTRVHYGYRRVHVMLRREGHMDNVKRVYRLYREEGLSLRLKRPRRNKAAKLRQPKQLAQAVNEIWSMDFVADALFDGRKLRMLTVVDLFTRECLAIDVGQSLKGEDVARVLTAITEVRGLPRTIKSDNVLNASGVPTNGNSISYRSDQTDRRKAKSSEQSQRRGSAAQGCLG
jgi:putative transposase